MEAELSPIMRNFISLYHNAVIFLFLKFHGITMLEISYNIIYTRKQSCFTQVYAYFHLYYILLNFSPKYFCHLTHSSTIFECVHVPIFLLALGVA